MNFKTPIYTLAAIALLSACSADESYKYTEVDPEAPITMSGAVNNSEQLTRKAIEGLADGPLTISLFRENEAYGTTYTTGPATATLDTDGTIATGMFYLATSTAQSKLIGLYPTASNYASGKVTYTAIDGATDIMASNQVEGSKGSPVTTPMKFEHLLTRVIVNIQATTEGAGKWGAVTAINVVGKKQAIEVTLPAPNGSGTATVAATGTGNLPLTAEDGGTADAKTPGSTSTLFGQAMFAPLTTNGTFDLEVVTATNGTHTVAVETRTYLPGYYYTLNLSFGATGITLTETTISPWGNGGTQPEIEL